MEAYSQRIRHHLDDLLDDLAPHPDTDRARDQLNRLFEEIGVDELQVRDRAATRAGEIPAVVDFSLTVLPGETIGIVGESGCGKSTVAMAVMQYMGANGGIKSGSITFNDIFFQNFRISLDQKK